LATVTSNTPTADLPRLSLAATGNGSDFLPRLLQLIGSRLLGISFSSHQLRDDLCRLPWPSSEPLSLFDQIGCLAEVQFFVRLTQNCHPFPAPTINPPVHWPRIIAGKNRCGHVILTESAAWKSAHLFLLPARFDLPVDRFVAKLAAIFG
jgi:hypothetical protein